MKTPHSGKKIFIHKFNQPSTDYNFKRNNSQGNTSKYSELKHDLSDLGHTQQNLENPKKVLKFDHSPNSETDIKPSKSGQEGLIQNQVTPAKKGNLKLQTDDSIKEDEYNEKGKGSSSNCDEENVDEFYGKKSIYNDYYTDSIGEATSSFIGRGNRLINTLPKPIVRHNGRSDQPDINEKDNISNMEEFLNVKTNEDIKENTRDSNCRKLISLAQKGDKENFLNLLEIIYNTQPSDINFVDESGWTALHHAVNEGNLKIVSILIRTNANINCLTIDKKTPLHISSTHGYFDISKLLVENGATIGLLDSDKNNPLHICSKLGHYELLKFLLERYPQADSKNIYGMTPIDITSHPRCKALLQEYLNSNSNTYHKVKIHKTNNKSANNLILNFKNTQQGEKVNNNKVNQVEFPKKISHPKHQSNEFKLSPSNKESNNMNKNFMNNTMKNKFNNKIQININIKDNIIIEDNKSSDKIKQLINNVSNSSKSKEGQIKVINVDKLFKNDISSEENQSISYSEQESKSPLSNSMDEEKICPQSFICHALLGKGSFGEVYLVEKKNTKSLYAMKVLSKDRIMAQNLVRYAMTERNVLSITNHPFIVKLSYAFQTSDKLFLILDYCPGGDLSEHLAKEKRFTEERAKIYLCEVVLALEDLHKRDIIFRDLKPDNVVLDKQGHALLTDFGLSKEGVLDNKGAKSFCGSIAYLAPEMLKKTGHGKSVDWYLLGVLFYEMLVGIPPYFTNSKEQIFKNIEKGELQIPKFISDEAKNLLFALLNKDPFARLGAGKSDALEVKRHPYFKDVNWNDVYEKKLNPPVPVCKKVNLNNEFKPRIFEDFNSNNYDDKIEHFDGWSFVNSKGENK